MFDRGVLFVGSGGIGLGVLAEAMALDHARKLGVRSLKTHFSALPLRIYSATTRDTAQTDPVLIRVMQRLKLDTSGLSLKPLALYCFAGAPRLDHVIMLGSELAPASRLALGEHVDVRDWKIETGDIAASAPGERYVQYLKLAQSLRQPIEALIGELAQHDSDRINAIAHSA
jgi:hypothetical protein